MLIFGLTGSVLAFRQEVDAMLNPHLYRVASTDSPIPLEEALDAAMRTAPSGWEGVGLELLLSEPSALPFAFYYAEPRASEIGAENLTVFVDPGSGHVIGQRTFYHPSNPLKHSFVGFFFKLHYAFFLGAAGIIVVGVIGTFLIISTASGVVIWWPRSGKWRRALSVKSGASGIRLTHDLHQVSGIYPLLVIVAVLISGLSFNLPDQFVWVVERFSPLSESVPTSAPPRDFVIDSALQGALAQFPGGRLQFLSLSAVASEPFTACYADVPSLRAYIQDTRCFTLNGATGELLAVQDATHGTGGDVFMGWQWPLHSGTILDLPGRILVFLSGLACAILPVTGFLRWIHKKDARARVAGKANRAEELSVRPRTGGS